MIFTIEHLINFAETQSSQYSKFKIIQKDKCLKLNQKTSYVTKTKIAFLAVFLLFLLAGVLVMDW